MLTIARQSESFSAEVDASASEALSIHPDASVHGDSGFVQVGFSHFFYQQYANFLNGMEQMGVSILSEPNNGTTDGAFIAPSSIAAANQSRSDARVAYLDPVLERSNLHVATGQMATRILLEQRNTSYAQLQTAVGVEVSWAGPSLSLCISTEEMLT